MAFTPKVPLLQVIDVTVNPAVLKVMLPSLPRHEGLVTVKLGTPDSKGGFTTTQ
jgi:hypothetical protein